MGTKTSILAKALNIALSSVTVIGLGVSGLWTSVIGPVLWGGTMVTDTESSSVSSSIASPVSDNNSALSSSSSSVKSPYEDIYPFSFDDDPPGPIRDTTPKPYPEPWYPPFRYERESDRHITGIFNTRHQSNGGAMGVLYIHTMQKNLLTLTILLEGTLGGERVIITMQRYFDGEFIYGDVVDTSARFYSERTFLGDDSTTIIFRLLDRETLQLVTDDLIELPKGSIFKIT